MEGGQETDGWVAYGSAANKYWASADSEQKFVKFSDNKNGRTKQWNIREYSGETPSAELFQAPDNCNERCPSLYDYGCQ